MLFSVIYAYKILMKKKKINNNKHKFVLNVYSTV